MFKKTNQFEILSFVTLLFFAFFPLFFSLPFRIHLDLPYEGAFRIYSGQMPFKDFTMPLGFGFFIFPTICFYIFGPFLKSLLISQAIVTLIGGISLMGILKNLKIKEIHVFIAILVFCLSYTFIYFWPWYNNTAFTFQLLATFLILKAFEQKSIYLKIIYTIGSASLVALTFLTKQDYGGLAFIFIAILSFYMAIANKDYLTFTTYLLAFALCLTLMILPFVQYDFFYWFNLGKPPHENRLKMSDIVNEFFLHSEWEKFYILAIGLILINRFQDIKKYFKEPNNILFALICTGFILEALITKITSKQSQGNTTYFHAFGIIFILTHLKLDFNLKKLQFLIPVVVLILLWWSGMFWKYANKVFVGKSTTESIQTKDTSTKSLSAQEWTLSEFKTFEKVKLPISTIEGIRKLKRDSCFSIPNKSKVLNMSELTMLAAELKYTPLKGLPLWYHLNIGIFQNQVDSICLNIEQKKYDIVLFEEIPSLDNFFPEEVRICLKKNYKLQDSFLAPRKEGDSFIEVYKP